jgi:hypothetical protein
MMVRELMTNKGKRVKTFKEMMSFFEKSGYGYTKEDEKELSVLFKQGKTIHYVEDPYSGELNGTCEIMFDVNVKNLIERNNTAISDT